MSINNSNNSNNFYYENIDDPDKEIKVIEDAKLINVNNDNNKSLQPSQSKLLVDLIKENSSLFKTEFDIPYALVDIDGHYEVLQIESKKFKRYLFKKYYDTFGNKIPSSENIKNAIQILDAEAIFKGPTISLHLRTAWIDNERKDAIYYDLTDSKNRHVKITLQNWEVVTNQTDVLFKKYNHLLPQVNPFPQSIRELDSMDTKYSKIPILKRFMSLFNISDSGNKLLLECYIISLFIPDLPKPVLILHGEQGGAKSTSQELIKMLVDPSSIPTLTFPRDTTEFVQQLDHNYIIYYDNGTC
ncbi:MAG: hypothetical protein ACPKPY_10855 [Nitrososphaeraceae archaeon]